MDLVEIRVGRCGMHASGSGQGPVEGPCEHANETLGSIQNLSLSNYNGKWRKLYSVIEKWNILAEEDNRNKMFLFSVTCDMSS
jgi:hypothetical protein